MVRSRSVGVRTIELTEKSKDTILNVLLLCSVLLLLSGFVRPDTSKKTNNPTFVQPKVSKLEPLQASAMPEYTNVVTVSAPVGVAPQASISAEPVIEAPKTPKKSEKNYTKDAKFAFERIFLKKIKVYPN